MPSSVAFFIYKNDILLSVKSSKVHMYADNTIIFFSSNAIYIIINAVNEDLMLLKTWLNENELSLRVAETPSLLLGNR